MEENKKIILKAIVALVLLAFALWVFGFLKQITRSYNDYYIQFSLQLLINLLAVSIYSIFFKPKMSAAFAVSSSSALLGYFYVFHSIHTCMQESPLLIPIGMQLSSLLFVHLCTIAVSCLLFFAYKRLWLDRKKAVQM